MNGVIRPTLFATLLLATAAYADPSLTGQDRKTALQLAEATRETAQNAQRRGAVIRRLRRS